MTTLAERRREVGDEVDARRPSPCPPRRSPAPAPVRDVPVRDAAVRDAAGRGLLRRFWFVPAAVAVVGAAALVPTVGGDGLGAGEARVVVAGIARVTEADGDVHVVRDARVRVGPGDVVAVAEGTARFEMADGIRLEGTAGALGAAGGVGAAGPAGVPGTTVEMGVRPTLVSGSLLAVAPSPLVVRAGTGSIAIGPLDGAPGAARLDRRRGLGVGAYGGEITLTSAGSGADVAPLRRLDVAAPGEMGPRGRPVRYSADDPWDRRFLGTAISIDAQLAPLLAGLAAADHDVLLDPHALRAVVPGLPAPDVLHELLATVDHGAEALVLAAIATAVDGTAVADTWRAGVAFHDLGAEWGLVAMDRGALASRVLETVRRAVDDTDLTSGGTGAASRGAPPDAADGSGPAITSDAPTAGSDATDAAAVPSAEVGEAAASDGATPAPGPAPVPVPVAEDPSEPGEPGAPPPVEPPVVPPVVPPPSEPSTPSLPPPVGPVVDGVVGGVGGVVGGVVDGLDGVVPGAGDVVGGVVGGVGGVVGDVGAAVEGVGGAAGGVGGPVVGGVGGVVGGLGGSVGGLGRALGDA